ncbi:MAG: Cysteine-tRNA ligase [Parcubacteria group bacterium GW2011_GWE2_39_37]|uniref:Cysteine--tRNA ligase n=1 Tax=Candidatus Falkowbacteria bacterium GW2011_GWF2_39_8 TaxID=1618642 RepID=A0A0G0T3N6_9BACT|nr:MAG: Cysteine-tRNA ligase [Parcubacteria group bacterium GW2011_GWE2_39_37]KKR32457.1 MAG: Cysteine-tRNA ligase [Candidatus Falkowbacteria bacterium GW2011_GWF2_39_8]
MEKLYLYNTLNKRKEEFRPLVDNKVGLYTCGPTVYNYAHIGNLRTYIFEDILKRVLLYNGYKVKHIMNITDVGHLTGDMNMGEDKLELGAKREGKTAWEIAEFYTKAFNEDVSKLNILKPDKQPKATDYIQEQIDLIKKLEKKGYTYKTSDGIYFDTAKFKNYNKLSHLKLDELKEGARVERNLEKKNPTDFALWKFSEPLTPPSLRATSPYKEEDKISRRQMEWESPWGVGFPGWHIECSAMSLKLLGKQLDIHCGGIDHINIHHTNEIAQSEAATGRKFFNYWLHGAFLNIAGGKKMAKSDENFLTLENALVKKGINPLAYRYGALSTHYRKPMEYSEEAIRSAQKGLDKLWKKIMELKEQKAEGKDRKVNAEFKIQFLKVINDDLNTPKALALVQKVLKSDLSPEEKFATVLDFDQVLGLGLDIIKIRVEKSVIFKWDIEGTQPEAARLLKLREKARAEKNWPESDRLREEIEKLGYSVEDTKEGMRIKKI